MTPAQLIHMGAYGGLHGDSRNLPYGGCHKQGRSESDLALAALFRGAKLDIVSDMTT